MPVLQYEEQTATHQILSDSSSDPLRPSSPSTHRPELSTSINQSNVQEKRLEHEDTDTRVLSDPHKDTLANDDDGAQSDAHTKERTSGMDAVVTETNESEQEGADVENKRRDTSKEVGEKEEQHTDMLRWGTVTRRATTVTASFEKRYTV